MEYAVTSDIHLGHPRTPTSHIINSFKKHILTELNKNIKVLFISGDLFDRLLDFNSKEVYDIVVFLNQLLSYCADNNIKLRVLEGTPSHDWKQSFILVKLNEIRKVKADLKYFQVLDIEYMADENKYVLYIPDEWTNSHEDMEQQITDKLSEHGISTVDIAILHGQFKYQLEGIPYNGFHYKEEYFLKLVTGFIHVGHYHVYNPMDRIIPNGSLERLAQNEEGPKGYVVVKDTSYAFIENPDAFIYKTIQIRSNTTLDRLDAIVKQYPHGSFIRLKMHPDHPFNVNFKDLTVRYVDYRLSKKLSKEDDSKSVTHINTEPSLDIHGKFVIDHDVAGLVVSRIKEKTALSDSEERKLSNYLGQHFKSTMVEEQL